MQLKKTIVAGIEIGVPSDFGTFTYAAGDPFGMYLAFETNNLGSILVSELVPHEDMALSDFTQDTLSTYLLGDYTDVSWTSYDMGRDFSQGIAYNLGKCTMKSSTGIELAGEIMVLEYEDVAFQFVVAIYAPDNEDSELGTNIDRMMSSINPDNETMANYIVDWAVYSAAGMDTAQLSEPANLEAANKAIEQASNN